MGSIYLSCKVFCHSCPRSSVFSTPMSHLGFCPTFHELPLGWEVSLNNIRKTKTLLDLSPALPQTVHA